GGQALAAHEVRVLSLLHEVPAAHIDDGAFAGVGDGDGVAEAHGVVVQVPARPVLAGVEDDAGPAFFQLLPHLRGARIEADGGADADAVADADGNLDTWVDAAGQFLVGRIILAIGENVVALGIDDRDAVEDLLARALGERDDQGGLDIAGQPADLGD